MYHKRILTRLNQLNFPLKESLQKLPIVELAGQSRVFIENHLGIFVYTQEEIHIKMHYGKLIIKGNALNLLHFGKDQLVVHGTIEYLQLMGR